METYYNHLNKKLDCLQQKQPKSPKSSHRKDEQFYPRIKNLTNIIFKEEETHLLRYGLNYSIEKLTTTFFTNVLTEIE